MKAIYYDANSGERLTSRSTSDTISAYISALDKVKNVKVHGRYAEIVSFNLNPTNEQIEVRILFSAVEAPESMEVENTENGGD